MFGLGLLYCCGWYLRCGVGIDVIADIIALGVYVGWC